MAQISNLRKKHIRFCLNCMKEQYFIFNEKLGHSECTVCENYQAVHPDNKITIKWVKWAYIKGLTEADNKENKPTIP